MKKITLNKETVRKLNDKDLDRANGGAGRPETLFACDTKRACGPDTKFCTGFTCQTTCMTGYVCV